MAFTLKSDYPLIPETLCVSSARPSANKSKKKKTKFSICLQVQYHVVDEFLCQNSPLDLVMIGFYFVFNPIS